MFNPFPDRITLRSVADGTELNLDADAFKGVLSTGALVYEYDGRLIRVPVNSLHYDHELDRWTAEAVL